MRLKFVGLLVIGTIVSVIYYSTLPHTVQFGDTAELVRAAKNLEVAHPPGYPLFIWLLHIWLKLVSGISVFWSASLLTAIFSVISCGLIYLSSKTNKLTGAAIALTTATSLIFWRYSVLPDVFSLHALLIAMILFFYFQKNQRLWNYAPLIFLLSISHHLTIIFLAPVVAHVFIVNVRSVKHWTGYVITGMLVIGLYVSLTVMHPDSFMSWGQVDGINAVFQHFLRADYGTFKLSPTESDGHFTAILAALLKQFLRSFWSVLIFGFVAFAWRLSQLKNLTLKDLLVALSLVLYTGLFFGLSKINPTGFWLETISRFFIFFNIVFVFWALQQIVEARFNRELNILISSVIFANAIANFVLFRNLNDFSKNTIIEDSAINYLKQTDEIKNGKVLLLQSDTRFNAAQYIQSVKGAHQDVIITHPKILFFPWYWSKIQKFGLYLNTEKIKSENALNLPNDFLLPNFEKFSFVTNLPLEDSKAYHIAIAPNSLLISKGEGIEFLESKLKLNSNFEVIKSSLAEYDLTRDVWNDYAKFYIYKANAYLSLNRNDLAAGELTKAINLVPWHYNAMKSICNISQSGKETCNENYETMKREIFPYF